MFCVFVSVVFFSFVAYLSNIIDTMYKNHVCLWLDVVEYQTLKEFLNENSEKNEKLNNIRERLDSLEYLYI